MGLREGYDLAAHIAGTFPTSMEVNTSSSSDDITTSPLIAFLRFTRLDLTTLMSRLNRISSCLQTIIDCCSINAKSNRFACFWRKGYQRGSLGKSHQNGDNLKQAMRKNCLPAGNLTVFIEIIQQASCWV